MSKKIPRSWKNECDYVQKLDTETKSWLESFNRTWRDKDRYKEQSDVMNHSPIEFSDGSETVDSPEAVLIKQLDLVKRSRRLESANALVKQQRPKKKHRKSRKTVKRLHIDSSNQDSVN